MPKTIFQKKNSKYEILNHFYFGPKFFEGSSLGRFSQCILASFTPTFLFSNPPNPTPPHHYRHHKKATYGPEMPVACYSFLIFFVSQA